MATPEGQIPGQESPEAGAADSGSGGESGQPQGQPQPQPQPAVIPDVEGVPEELRGMPIERFSETWNLTRQALASHQYLQQQQAAAQQAAQPAQPADTRSLAERLQDPETTEQALSEWLERSYGPTFQNVAQSALEGTLAGMRTTIPDFSKYEKRTRETLARLNVAPTQVTREIARYAYLIARGEESEQEAARATREPKPEQVATEPPTPQRDKPPEVELTSMQLEIAGRLGKTPEQYKEWLRKGAYQTMTDVPTERKDYGKPAAAPTE